MAALFNQFDIAFNIVSKLPVAQWASLAGVNSAIWEMVVKNVAHRTQQYGLNCMDKYQNLLTLSNAWKKIGLCCPMTHNRLPSPFLSISSTSMSEKECHLMYQCCINTCVPHTTMLRDIWQSYFVKHGFINLLLQMKLTNEEVTNETMMNACTNGHVSVIKYLHQTFTFTWTLCDLLKVMIQFSYLDAIVYFVEEVGATCDDFCAGDVPHSSPIATCKVLPVLAYLVESLPFCATDMHETLLECAHDNNVECTKYLCKKFTFDKSVARDTVFDACVYSYMDVELIQFLVEEFQLEKEEIISAAMEAAFHDNFHIVLYFLQKFEFSVQEITQLLYDACHHLSLEFINGVHEKYTLSESNVKMILDIGERYSHNGLIQFLVQHNYIDESTINNSPTE